MHIHFHDLETQYAQYHDEIHAALERVMSSCRFIMGPAVTQFETSLAHFLNAKAVIGCASGTDALLLALMAIDLKPDEEVITTPFTFIATAEVIRLLGARPVFVDIEPSTYHLDVSQIASKMTPKTRAILPVSLYGLPPDMDAINDIAADYSKKIGHKIYVIEDAAQSLGATYHEQRSGNLSDMGCLSFFPSKPLGCYGDGGAVVTNDLALAEKIKSLRIHGQIERYEHHYLGINGRLDTMQAAILQVKLKYFPHEIKERTRVAKRYHDLLASFDLALPTVPAGRTSVYAQYSIRVSNRERLLKFLKSKNVPTAVHYPKPLHLQPCLSSLGFRAGDFPVAEKISTEIMSLPMGPFVTEAAQTYIAACFSEATKELNEIADLKEHVL